MFVQDGPHQVGPRPCDAPNENDWRASVVFKQLTEGPENGSFAWNLKKEKLILQIFDCVTTDCLEQSSLKIFLIKV